MDVMALGGLSLRSAFLSLVPNWRDVDGKPDARQNGRLGGIRKVIPKMLEDWSLPELWRVLTTRIFESDRFDFKEALPDARNDQAKLRLRKTCCAFANSAGGFLVFGVKDEKELDVEARLIGLEPTFDFPASFGDYPSRVEPSVQWDFKNPPLELSSGRLIHVVHIPKSHSGPHGLFVEDRCFFQKRTPKGNEPMTYGELRAKFLDRDRLVTELHWAISEFSRVERTAKSLNVELHRDQWTYEVLMTRFDVVDVRPSLKALAGVFKMVDPELGERAVNTINQCSAIDVTLGAIQGFVNHRAGAIVGEGLELLARAKELVIRTSLNAENVRARLESLEQAMQI